MCLFKRHMCFPDYIKYQLFLDHHLFGCRGEFWLPLNQPLTSFQKTVSLKNVQMQQCDRYIQYYNQNQIPDAAYVTYWTYNVRVL